MRIPRPPKDLDSFLGRKWLEALTRNSEEGTTLFNSPFVVISPTAGLTNSRVLSVDLTITETDGGAGSSVTLGLNLAHSNIWGAAQSVPDEAYSASWDSSLEVPTKNAVYDQIESITSASNDIEKLLHMGY